MDVFYPQWSWWWCCSGLKLCKYLYIYICLKKLLEFYLPHNCFPQPVGRMHLYNEATVVKVFATKIELWVEFLYDQVWSTLKMFYAYSRQLWLFFICLMVAEHERWTGALYNRLNSNPLKKVFIFSEARK